MKLYTANTHYRCIFKISNGQLTFRSRFEIGGSGDSASAGGGRRVLPVFSVAVKFKPGLSLICNGLNPPLAFAFAFAVVLRSSSLLVEEGSRALSGIISRCTKCPVGVRPLGSCSRTSRPTAWPLLPVTFENVKKRRIYTSTIFDLL